MSDPIGEALHVEAEAARAEIRAAAIVCPSCGVNMADLPREHKLAIDGDENGPWSAQCASGNLVPLADFRSDVQMDEAGFKVWEDVVNVELHDTFRAAEAAALGL